MTELGEVLTNVLKATAADLRIDSPHLRASRQFTPSFVELGKQERLRAELPENDRPATVAEVFTGYDLIHCFRMRYGGMMLRALEIEMYAGHGTPTIRAEHATLEARYNEWAGEVLAAPASPPRSRSSRSSACSSAPSSQPLPTLPTGTGRPRPGLTPREETADVGRYAVRRLLQLVLVFFGVTLLIYFAVFTLPGDPIQNLAGHQQLPPTTLNNIRAQYHLNDPFWEQYWRASPVSSTVTSALTSTATACGN